MSLGVSSSRPSIVCSAWCSSACVHEPPALPACIECVRLLNSAGSLSCRAQVYGPLVNTRRPSTLSTSMKTGSLTRSVGRTDGSHRPATSPTGVATSSRQCGAPSRTATASSHTGLTCTWRQPTTPLVRERGNAGCQCERACQRHITRKRLAVHKYGLPEPPIIVRTCVLRCCYSVASLVRAPAKHRKQGSQSPLSLPNSLVCLCGRHAQSERRLEQPTGTMRAHACPLSPALLCSARRAHRATTRITTGSWAQAHSSSRLGRTSR